VENIEHMSYFKQKSIALSFLIFGSYISQAQFLANDTLNFTTLQITEKRFADQSLMNEGHTVQIISSADIQALPVKTIAEVLTYVAGIDLDERGLLGAQADLSLQGAGFEQTLILVNGIPMRDAQTGHHLMNLPVDINQIERIEITYGAAGRLYGSNALAGAINFVTKKPNTYSSSFETYTGIADPRDNNGNGNALVGIQANATWGMRKAQHAIGVGLLKNDGYRYNSANTQYKLNYQGRVHLNNGHFLDIIGGTFFNEFGANGFYAAPYDVDAVETVNTSYFALQSSIQKNKWTLRPLAYYRYNSDHYVFIADQPEVYQNWHFGTTAGAELHASQKNKWGNFGLGIESRGEILASNNLGKRSRYYFNTYAEQQLKLGDKTTVVAGVNGQFNASSNTYSFFPGVEMNQTISNTVRAYANLGTGNRMASFTEMYYVGPGNIGNDSLNSEMARYVEVGMRKSGKIQFNASAFYRQVIDAITYTRETGTTVWAPSNFTSVVYKGAQFNAAMKVMNKTNFSLNYMYLDANFSLDEGIETKYAFEHARHRLVGQLSYQWNKSFSTLLAGRYVHRFIGTNYTLFDLRLNWNLRENVSMTADITNLLNRKYIDSGFVEMPGRWYRIGFKFNLNNK